MSNETNQHLPKLPSLTALSRIVQEVQAEQAKPGPEKMPPNYFTLRKALETYAIDRVNMLRYNVLPAVGLKIDADAKKVFILARSEEEKELVQSETRLMEHLRATVQLDGIALIVQAWQPVTE